MKWKSFSAGPCFVFVMIFFSFLQVSAMEKDDDIQNVIHILEYISKDYAGAVKDGKVYDIIEYDEMQEFSAKLLFMAQKLKLPSASPVLSDLQELKDLILNKASGKEVKTIAEKVKWAIIEATNYEAAPLNWPDQTKGKQLYLQNCFQCHGSQGGGNGDLADGLKPAPTNFLNDEVMSRSSPLEAFNSIKLGVEGTAMRPYTELTDEEAWQLAFYVKSLRFRKQDLDSASLRRLFDKEYSKVSLKDIATLSDTDLMEMLDSEKDSPEKLMALRVLSPSAKSSATGLQIARALLLQSSESYKNGDKKDARQKALSAYLEGIEPVEARLRTIDSEFTSGLEQKMMAVRQAIEKNSNFEEVENKIDTALNAVSRAEKMITDEKLNYWLSFFLATSIMLREGLEAFLIIALILALIRRTPEAKKALPYLHGGWITAVLTGVAGWFLADQIIVISGQNREIMEGTISLLAVIILAFAGFWLHDHSHSKKWKEFIDKKIKARLLSKNMLGLAFFSFMVVFREAFESILFLKAISLENHSGGSSIGFGVLAAFILIGVLAVLFIKFSKKLPVSQLFRYSSWVTILLAVILLGKGIHSIQEAGWLSVSELPFFFKIDWLGIYPSLESLVSQLVLLCFLILLAYLNNYRERVGQLHYKEVKK